MDALQDWNVRRTALEELGPLQYSSEQIFWCKKLSLMNALKIGMFITRATKASDIKVLEGQEIQEKTIGPRFERKPREGSKDLAGNRTKA